MQVKKVLTPHEPHKNANQQEKLPEVFCTLLNNFDYKQFV